MQTARDNQSGFTLIEVMIVVAIIGVLAAIAYPSYQRYVIKSKRVDMMTEMHNIASEIEANKLAVGSYSDIKLSTIFSSTPNSDGEVSFPTAGTALYTVTATSNDKTTLNNGQWTITAEPQAGQMASDGNLTLNYQGVKCRGDGADKKCGTGDEWN